MKTTVNQKGYTMKASEALLKGMQKVNYKQTEGQYFKYNSEGQPVAACCLGAIALGKNKEATPDDAMTHEEFHNFYKHYGVFVPIANDNGMPWYHVYGMLKAINN